MLHCLMNIFFLNFCDACLNANVTEGKKKEKCDRVKVAATKEWDILYKKKKEWDI